MARYHISLRLSCDMNLFQAFKMLGENKTYFHHVLECQRSSRDEIHALGQKILPLAEENY